MLLLLLLLLLLLPSHRQTHLVQRVLHRVQRADVVKADGNLLWRDDLAGAA